MRQSIRDSLAKTKERRRNQICKQYEIKIDRSHPSKETLEHMERLFLEAKWFYNRIVPSKDVFALPDDHYKTKEVAVKVKDKYETRRLDTERLTRREVTPADTYASTLSLEKYLISIPRVSASDVVETGCPAVIVKGTIFSRG